MSYPEEPLNFSIDDFCKVWKADTIAIGQSRFPQSPKGVAEAERDQMVEIVKENESVAKCGISRLPPLLRMSPGWENITLEFKKSSTGVSRLVGVVPMDIAERGTKEYFVEFTLSEFGEGLLLLQCRYHDAEHESDNRVNVWHDGVWHAVGGMN